MFPIPQALKMYFVTYSATTPRESRLVCTESYKRFHEDPPAGTRVAIEILSPMRTVVRTKNISTSSPGFHLNVILFPSDEP